MNKRLRRALLCLGVGAVAALRVGFTMAYPVVTVCVAGILWLIGDMLDGE